MLFPTLTFLILLPIVTAYYTTTDYPTEYPSHAATTPSTTFTPTAPPTISASTTEPTSQQPALLTATERMDAKCTSSSPPQPLMKTAFVDSSRSSLIASSSGQANGLNQAVKVVVMSALNYLHSNAFYADGGPPESLDRGNLNPDAGPMYVADPPRVFTPITNATDVSAQRLTL
ncbi:MAG: hypothetical protein Q9168_002522 [Polycauliona sp. 1 TL-2023]